MIYKSSKRSSNAACYGITQFYLPPTRFIPARVEQDLELYIRNELQDVAAHFTDLERTKA